LFDTATNVKNMTSRTRAGHIKINLLIFNYPVLLALVFIAGQYGAINGERFNVFFVRFAIAYGTAGAGFAQRNHVIGREGEGQHDAIEIGKQVIAQPQVGNSAVVI
jgi:hypothetical protein